MLAALDITVCPEVDCELPHPCAHMLHAAMLNLVRSVDPAMSAILHDDTQNKPFSLSTLWPRTGTTGDYISVPGLTHCDFRLCMASKSVFEAFARPLFAMIDQSESIILGDSKFSIIDAQIAGTAAGATTFKDILRDTGTTALLRFDSPVSFRRKGLGVPLPDPQLVYGSLWQKWQAFSDVPVPDGVFTEMMDSLALRAMDGNTRVWKFPRNMIVGYVGTAEYKLVRKVSPEAQALFGGLTQLSFYTGVGSKTTMGMGQCRLLTKTEASLREEYEMPSMATQESDITQREYAGDVS